MTWLQKCAGIRYYHGSTVDLPVGTILTPQMEGYTRWEENRKIEQIVEQYRPPNKISRHDAVFMVDDPNLIDSAGGYTDYIYIVEPIGVVEQSDLSWYSAISVYGDYNETDDQERTMDQLAQNYWSGVKNQGPHSLIEYRARSARITGIDPSSDSVSGVFPHPSWFHPIKLRDTD